MLSITGDHGNTTIMRCHHIPSRMATLKRLDSIKGEDAEKLEQSNFWWESKLL